MNITIPADPRLRKRAILIALTITLMGLVSLYLFHRFLCEMEALATAAPQLAFEKLNPVTQRPAGCHALFCDDLAYLLGYASLRVYRAGSGPHRDGVSFTPCRFVPDDILGARCRIILMAVLFSQTETRRK